MASPFVLPSHTPYQWQNAPSTQTPLDAAHLIAAEQDLVAYIQQMASSYDSYAQGQFVHQDGTGLPTFGGPAYSRPVWNGSQWVAEQLDKVDLCAEFGVSVNNADNSALISNAIQTLGLLGIDGYLPINSVGYPITNPIVIGNGTSNAVSTWTSVLRGGGMPTGGLITGNVSGPHSTIKWNGAAGFSGAMIEIAGPITGWGLENIQLNGGSAAIAPALGILVTSGSYAKVLRNIQMYNVISGIHEMCGGFNNVIQNNSAHNLWESIVIKWLGSQSGGVANGPFPYGYSGGIWFDGMASPSGDTNLEMFRHLTLLCPGNTSSGMKHSDLYFGACDSNLIEHAAMSTYGSGGTDTHFKVTYDYTIANVWPADNTIRGVDFASSASGLFQNIGTPAAGATPNKILEVAKTNGQPPNPSLANLAWGYRADGSLV